MIERERWVGIRDSEKFQGTRVTHADGTAMQHLQKSIHGNVSITHLCARKRAGAGAKYVERGRDRSQVIEAVEAINGAGVMIT